MSTAKKLPKPDLAACLDDVSDLVADALIEVKEGGSSFSSLHLALVRVAARIASLKLEVYPHLLQLVVEANKGGEV